MKKIILISVLVLVFVIGGCDTSKNKVIEPTCPDNVYKQPQTREGAEATADKFAREWEQKDFSVMYDMFIPELQSLKTKDEFTEVMNYLETGPNLITIRLDKISMEDNSTSYAYYTTSSSLFDVKAPAMKLNYVNCYWGVDAFSTYFYFDLNKRKYIDTVSGLNSLQSLLIYQFNTNLDKHYYEWRKYNLELYTAMSDIYKYCPDFKENFEDAKNNSEMLLSLNVPEGFEVLSNITKEAYTQLYLAFEEMYLKCKGGNLNLEKQQNLMETSLKNFEKAKQMLEELRVTYQTDKEKVQNK